MSAFSIVNVAPPPRGDAEQTPHDFALQSITLTWSWGAQPESATLVYIGDAPVSAGAELTITVYGNPANQVFYGICKKAPSLVSSQGNTRSLEFVHMREFLSWDIAYCAFNKSEIRMVNGKRVRHFWHILPVNFNALKRTTSAAPLTAAQILNYLFAAPTTETPWVRVYHNDQVNYPIFDIDCLSGKTLAAVVQEISAIC